MMSGQQSSDQQSSGQQSSGQQPYVQDRTTGEFFTWSASHGVFVGNTTRRLIYPNTPEARQLVTIPRTVSSQPPPVSAASGSPPSPSSSRLPANYTYTRRNTIPSSNESAGSPQAVAAPHLQGSSPPQQAWISSIGAAYRPTQASITDTSEGYEELDKRYRIRPHGFFKIGRVFMVHWAEPAGEASTVTRFSEEPPRELWRDPRFGQRIHTKIRRFIVVRDANGYCLCVRIATYGGQGVAKRDVDKAEHAIAYCGSAPPNLLPQEASSSGGERMRKPIRIQPDETGDKLENASRIDYGRIYTVEHNVKARAFGQVHANSLRQFYYDARNVNSSSSVLQGQGTGESSLAGQFSALQVTSPQPQRTQGYDRTPAPAQIRSAQSQIPAPYGSQASAPARAQHREASSDEEEDDESESGSDSE